jgi:tetratricopeptide (TPR) repeat protein
VACWKVGRIRAGVPVAEQGLAVARRCGDRYGTAVCHDLLGLLRGALGEFAVARAHLTCGIAAHRAAGVPRMEAEALVNLASVASWTGDHAGAARAAARAAGLDRELGARDHEITSLTWWGIGLLGLGDVVGAKRCLDRARGLCDDESRSPASVALVLAYSAEVHQRVDRPALAWHFAERALELARRRGTPARQAVVANVVAVVCRRRGEHARALELHGQAHRLAERIGYRVEAARALDGMALAAERLGDAGAAAEHRARADASFTALGVPESARRFPGPGSADGRPAVVAAVGPVADGGRVVHDSPW